MHTKLIELKDGTLVEVETTEEQAQQIAGGFVENVNTSLDKIQPILMKVSRPIIAAWNELNKDMLIEHAEVELGLSFEGEGNLYVTKSKAGANLIVKLILKPKEL